MLWHIVYGLVVILISVLSTCDRDNLLEEMLQEPDEVALKRKRTRETLRVLQQAFKVRSWFVFIQNIDLSFSEKC